MADEDAAELTMLTGAVAPEWLATPRPLGGCSFLTRRSACHARYG